jgi:transketolase C-terminal domain/subunit
VHTCLAAAEQLAGEGINARVIDLYSVQPIDTETLTAAAAATGGRRVVGQDPKPAGGGGAAVGDARVGAGVQALRRTPRLGHQPGAAAQRGHRRGAHRARRPRAGDRLSAGLSPGRLV